MSHLVTKIARQLGTVPRETRRIMSNNDVKAAQSLEEDRSSIPDRKNYTLKEAAVYLNVSTRTIERLLQRKLLRRNKALRKILIPRTELDSFLQRTL